MKLITRDAITSGVIGILASYLPFWEWDGTQATGALCLAVVAFVGLIATWPEPKRRKHGRL